MVQKLDLPEEPERLVAMIREKLALDPRVNELELDVRISQRKVFVWGKVPTVERQQAVGEVLEEMLAGYEVENETLVQTLSSPAEPEQL